MISPSLAMTDPTAVLMMHADFMSDMAWEGWSLAKDFVPWGNDIDRHFKGLPFGPYLHSSQIKRKRTLTSPVGQASSANIWKRLNLFPSGVPEQATSEQLDCAFLAKLPLDVRLIIYEMVLGGKKIYVGAQPDKQHLFHSIIDSTPTTKAENSAGPRWQSTGAMAPPLSPGLLQKRPSSGPRTEQTVASNLLPLLLTCRQVYSEAIDTLYSSNAFDFTQIHALMRFLTIQVPRHRVTALRHLRVQMRVPYHPDMTSRTRRDWRDLFRFFADELTGLQSLDLRPLWMYPFEEAVLATTDDDAGAVWIRPMVAMAVDAHRARGCKVLVTLNGVTYDLVKLWKSTYVGREEAGVEWAVDLASVRLHGLLRASLAQAQKG